MSSVTRTSRFNVNRRELLQIGGFSFLGLNAAGLRQLRAAEEETSSSAKYRRNSCVFIFLFGGPSHIDLWDMKPEAPSSIRGEFNPVNTNVPGIQLC